MTDQRVENGRKMLADRRNLKHGFGIGIESFFALIGDHDRCCLVRPEYGRILDNIANHRVTRAGRADDNQRFRGQVDMLFILHEIR